ncbi:MAG: HD family phosphohydrolase [Desulfonatronovibrionaceae bacterium]
MTGSKKDAQTNIPRQHRGKGLLFLALLVLSVLYGINFQPRITVFLAGEVADRDVTATQALLIEDEESTKARREQVAKSQPPVFDLSLEPLSHLQKKVDQVLQTVDEVDPSRPEKFSATLDETDIDLSSSALKAWKNPELRKIYREKIKPWIKDRYEQGIVADGDFLSQYKSGILIRRLHGGMETLEMDIRRIGDVQSLERDFSEFLRRGINLRLRSRNAVEELIVPLLRPNLTLNQESTEQRLDQVLNQVDPVYHRVAKGEIVVRKGERVTPDQQKKLQALFRYKPKYFSPGRSLGLFLMLGAAAGVFFAVCPNWTSKVRLRERDISFIAMVTLVLGCCAKFLGLAADPLTSSLSTVNPGFFAYSLPVMGGAGLLCLFLRQRICVLAAVFLSLVCTILLDEGITVFLYFLAGSFLYIFLLSRASTRLQVLKSLFPLAGLLIVIWTGVNLAAWESWMYLGSGTVFVLAGAFFSLVIVLAFSPMVEYALGYTSIFRLMDMMNLEQPLLQRLMIEAPGTYHHSLVVSNLVEAGARKIGADSLLAKVAALYHDIGKLKNPEYFIENQYGGKNRHDKLAPSMSALILISHVKKGVEMARDNSLGEEIIDLIQQHHGTSLIAWFYNKAVERAGNKADKKIREEEFRYPGPKPQTKEAGLLLLADVIEASSRTLVEPTPSRLKGHIQNTIRRVYTEGELDESELTLRELYVLGEVFLKILTGIFHQRIDYPVERKKIESRESSPGNKKLPPGGKDKQPE